jgi:S-adenosylmethionine-diacylglycerol 3-amino-3-carboxypropyl transferase
VKHINSGQVQLSELIFTMSWEDPESDRKALRITPGDTLISITSGGCNTLSLLLERPSRVFAIDINPLQSYLLELKIAAMSGLNHGEYLEFLGVRHSSVRIAMYEHISGNLSEQARQYWNGNKKVIEQGILGMGRYERFIGLFRKILRLLQGSTRIHGLFEQSSIEEQRRYFETTWNTRRWKSIFKVFFNKRILARRGLTADYFDFDDGSVSFADSFFRRSKRAMTEIPVKTNYFLSQYLLGRYLSEQCVPPYLRAENFDVIRKQLNKVQIISADLKDWLQTVPEESIECFCISNICEVMNIEETNRTFEQILRTAKQGARVSFRNLMLPRVVPDYLTSRIMRNDELSRQLINSDSSFVYSRVDAYEINK